MRRLDDGGRHRNQQSGGEAAQADRDRVTGPTGWEARYARLIKIGIALSEQRDTDRLLDLILAEAKDFADADGGTLYRVDPERRQLTFAIMRNHSLGLALGGASGKPVPFDPLPLFDADGAPNLSNVATAAFHARRIIATPDAHAETAYDFGGTRAFDALTGYRSTSFLTIPLRDHGGEVIAVLQLINARDRTGAVIAFDPAEQPLMEALASQATVALENRLLLDAQQTLFKAFIDTITGAMDAKSPYTGGHCQRVSALTLMLADAACRAGEGPFAGFTLDADGWYQLEVAAGLHDCGKIATPEHIVDKATKLQTVFDRIELIRTRFAVAKRDVEIAYHRAVAAGAAEADAAAARDQALAELDDDLAFLAAINHGGEAMAPAAEDRVHRIAARTWTDTGPGIGGTGVPDGAPNGSIERPLLTADEVRNLCIRRGTLLPEERQVINDHILVTIDMLQRLPFPKPLSQVVAIAGAHHEKVDGTGYPYGLTGDQLPVEARLLAIADVFEALTAVDRPYKTAKPLSETVAILRRMRDDGHIDADAFALLLRSGVYRRFAERFLDPALIDAVDVEAAIGTAAIAG